MEKEIAEKKEATFKESIQHMHCKTQVWISEIKFIKQEQNFLKELLTEHIIGFCDSENFTRAKLYLNCINQEVTISETLSKSIQEHKVNLSLLIENIYLKKEDAFRKNNTYLKKEVENFIDNFKCIKTQVFDLVLMILKIQKEKNDAISE